MVSSMNEDTKFSLATTLHDDAWATIIKADRIREQILGKNPEVSALFMKVWEAESEYRAALFDLWREATK